MDRLCPGRLFAGRDEKLYPTYIEQSAEELESIAVSGGKIGMQIELAPDELAGMVNAKYGDLIK